MVKNTKLANDLELPLFIIIIIIIITKAFI